MLLAAKNVSQPAALSTNLSLKEKLSRELSKYLLLRGALDMSDNPCGWWRENHKLFPLLAMFWRAHCAFPATFTSSERAFSMNGLILDPKRYFIPCCFVPLICILFRMRLTADRTGNMTVCRDYWMSRTATDSYRICDKCPNPPSTSACYKISCSKHN